MVAVATTLLLLTVRLRDAAGTELCAIEDEEEAGGEEVEIAVGEEGIAVAEEASPLIIKRDGNRNR